MNKYIIAYHGGIQFATKEDGAKHMEKWKTWMMGLGKAIINPGTPVSKSKFVSANGVSDKGDSVPLSGYSSIEAESLDAAVEMTKNCPHLDMGTIEVAEMMDMKM